MTEVEFKDFRKGVVSAILATDMARHGEIMAAFKKIVEEGFNFAEVTHKSLLFQMLIKCSDISNEIRPNKIADPWVGNLLEEFFRQSDKEKAENLPTAPFMDRQKVTKASAQGNFEFEKKMKLY